MIDQQTTVATSKSIETSSLVSFVGRIVAIGDITTMVGCANCEKWTDDNGKKILECQHCFKHFNGMLQTQSRSIMVTTKGSFNGSILNLTEKSKFDSSEAYYGGKNA
ncbi:unnamed protein product, partial [Didymodactylos carnosus]